MTSDAVKASPEFKTAKGTYDTAFQRLRNFNSQYTKQFAPELKAERDRVRQARMK